MVGEEMSTPFEAALAELSAATQRYNELAKIVDDAYKAKTAASIRLNTAQKKFDELVRELKATAPRSSDWNQPKGERV